MKSSDVPKGLSYKTFPETFNGSNASIVNHNSAQKRAILCLTERLRVRRREVILDANIKRNFEGTMFLGGSKKNTKKEELKERQFLYSMAYAAAADFVTLPFRNMANDCRLFVQYACEQAKEKSAKAWLAIAGCGSLKVAPNLFAPSLVLGTVYKLDCSPWTIGLTVAGTIYLNAIILNNIRIEDETYEVFPRLRKVLARYNEFMSLKREEEGVSIPVNVIHDTEPAPDLPNNVVSLLGRRKRGSDPRPGPGGGKIA